MAERGFGRIVFIASDTVWSPPSPVLLPYIASKGALLAIMRTLAVALGPDGIAVSAVAPRVGVQGQVDVAQVGVGAVDGDQRRRDRSTPFSDITGLLEGTVAHPAEPAITEKRLSRREVDDRLLVDQERGSPAQATPA